MECVCLINMYGFNFQKMVCLRAVNISRQESHTQQCEGLVAGRIMQSWARSGCTDHNLALFCIEQK